MISLIEEAHGKKVRLTKVFNPVLRVMGLKLGIINKAFGNLVYKRSMSEYKEEYRVRDLRESVRVTEVF